MTRASASVAAFGLALLFSSQVVVGLFDFLGRQPVGLSELRALAGSGSTEVLVLHPSARARGPRGEVLAVPADWLNGPRRELVELWAAADGRLVAIGDGEGSDAPKADRTILEFRYRSRRLRVLAARCGSAAPCQEIVVARATRPLRLRVAAGRAWERPGLLALAGLVCAGVGLALRFSLRRLSGAAAAAGIAAVALLAGGWILARALSRPVGPHALAMQVALAVAVPSWRMLRRLETILRARLSPPLEDVSARISVAARAAHLSGWSGVVCIAAAAGLWLPLAVTDRTYFSDWSNHLYYLARQTESLRALLRPSYFLSCDLSGPFYPYYAFYGGTLYALAAALAVVVGSVRAAYAISFLVAFAMAFGGITWLSRQAGLARERAWLPGLVVVSSAYYLTNAYGRGSWAELIATSALPLLAAAGAALLRTAQPRPRDVLLFSLATMIFSGSHTITLLWGGAFLGLVTLLTRALLGAAALPMDRFGTILKYGLLAAACNGWFLVPALAYGRSTHIGGYAVRGFGSDAWFLNVPEVVFHPGRFVPALSGTPGLYVQASSYVLGAALLILWALKRSAPIHERRGVALLVGLVALFLALILTGRDAPTWRAVPRLLRMIQFQFRLHTYLTYAIAGLTLLALLRSRRSRSGALAVAVLSLAVAIQVGLGFSQIAASPRFERISDVVSAGVRQPASLLEAHDYRFLDHPDSVPLGEAVLPTPPRTLRLDPAAVLQERLAVELPESDVEYLTNVPYSPFVRGEDGISIVGRCAQGWAIVRSDRAVGPVRGRIVAATPPPVVGGRAVSLLGFTGLATALWRLNRGARPQRAAEQ